MLLDQLPADGKSQSGAGIGSTVVAFNLFEGRENALLVARLDTDSGIGNGDRQLAVTGRGAP
jgi:hypothetical protein